MERCRLCLRVGQAPPSQLAMCNLYSMTKSQQAVRDLVWVAKDIRPYSSLRAYGAGSGNSGTNGRSFCQMELHLRLTRNTLF